MDLNLAGKVAVVTGAGKGTGKAVTLALADEGAQVVAGSLRGNWTSAGRAAANPAGEPVSGLLGLAGQAAWAGSTVTV